MIYFRTTSSVLESKIDEEVIIMSIRNGFYYGLDSIASRIWEIISNKPATLDEISSILLEEYEIDIDKCREETLLFLDNMIEEGIVEKIEA